MKKLLPLLLILASCKKTGTTQQPDPVIVCDPATSYIYQVKSIFVNNCTASGCHDGVNLPSLAEFSVARDAARQIRDAVARGIMPVNAALPSTDRAAILCWIDNGAKNN